MDYLFKNFFSTAKAKYFNNSVGDGPFDGFSQSEKPSWEERAIDYLMRHLNFILVIRLASLKAKFADAWEPRYRSIEHTCSAPSGPGSRQISELRERKMIRSCPLC